MWVGSCRCLTVQPPITATLACARGECEAQEFECCEEGYTSGL